MQNKAPTQAEIRAALEALKIHENGRHATMLPDNAAQTIRYCLAAMADCVSYAELEAGIKILKDAYNADPEIRFYNKPIETIIKAARQHLRAQTPQGDGWLTIETAPKGEWILLRGRNTIGEPMIPVVANYHSPSGRGYGWWDVASYKNVNDLAERGADWQHLPKSHAASREGK